MDGQLNEALEDWPSRRRDAVKRDGRGRRRQGAKRGIGEALRQRGLSTSWGRSALRHASGWTREERPRQVTAAATRPPGSTPSRRWDAWGRQVAAAPAQRRTEAHAPAEGTRAGGGAQAPERAGRPGLTTQRDGKHRYRPGRPPAGRRPWRRERVDRKLMAEPKPVGRSSPLGWRRPTSRRGRQPTVRQTRP